FDVALACTGTHPWSRWQDQRIIDTPHYRRNNEILQYVVWRNNSFGIHAHIGIRGADRAVAVCNAFRNVLPELLALSASSPFVEGEPLPQLPNRLLEENLWRAIRYGLTNGLIDFERGEVVPARARIEALIEWVLPVAEEIGAAPYLAVPEANASERQYARLEQLGSHRDVFAELVRRPRELVGA